MMQRRMLPKEDEAGGEDVEVRREDQDKINKFSRLNQRDELLKEEMSSKNKEKEELNDLNGELEELELLSDEDQTVPYKIGDAFFHIKLDQAKELLEKAMGQVDEDISGLEDKLSTLKDEMTQLKVELYARFGKSINLEK